MENTGLNMLLPAWELLPDLGLYMDQVVTLADRAFGGALPKGEITKSMVNNYVKAGLLPRPLGKKYGREHLALLMMICVFKQALSMESIARLLPILCREGVRSGYERFAGEIAALDASFGGGSLSRAVPEDAEEQALCMGILAAVCTIRSGRLLDSEE